MYLYFKIIFSNAWDFSFYLMSVLFSDANCFSNEKPFFYFKVFSKFILNFDEGTYLIINLNEQFLDN